MPTHASEILLLRVKDAHVLQTKAIRQALAVQVKALEPYDFERLVLKVLKRLENVPFGKVTQRSRDGGIDGYISKDRVGRESIPFQAKRTDNTIGAPQVQQFCGAMTDAGASCGFFVATSKFSPDAHRCDLVRKRKLTLIDGSLLLDWMYEFDIGVNIDSKITLKTLSQSGLRLED